MTTLPTRPFGRTGMNITRVGFGAWAAGGGGWVYGWGPQDDNQSIAAMRHAVERGVNWIDTAAVYGFGHSEEVVGRALKEMPANGRPYVFTKGGLVWNEADRFEDPKRIGAAASIRKEVEASLTRLGVERIDLYQMHWPADDVPVEELWQTFLDLKKEGKLRAAGLSNHNSALLERAEKLGHVETLQPPFSAIRRDFAANELPWCRAHQTGVIVYSPMQAGLLTGRFTEERARNLPQDDWRRKNPNFTGEALRRNLAFAQALGPVAERHKTSIAAVALGWVLSWQGVSGAIVGARSPAQVDGWIDAARLELTPADLKEIAAAIAATGAGSGPALPQ
jgi:aryl-alcohol dehydrogenase-like predicted oxidoreductase